MYIETKNNSFLYLLLNKIKKIIKVWIKNIFLKISLGQKNIITSTIKREIKI